MKKILAIGELLWDLLPDKTILGGAPANFSYRMKSLGNDVILVTKLGTDDFGDKAIEKISQLGLPVQYIQRDTSLPTGTVKVFFDENKNPDYTIIKNVAYDNIEYTPDIQSVVQNLDCIYYGTLIQRSNQSAETVRKILEEGKKSLKFLDINFRKECFSKEIVVYSLQKADIIKLNEDEVIMLKDLLSLKYNTLIDISKEVMEKYQLKYCLVTLAQNGAFVLSNTGEKEYTPGYNVQLADPLGAGDAFSAGFIHSFLQNKTLIECLQAGNILGAIVSTQKGATQPISEEDRGSLQAQAIKMIYHNDFEKLIHIPKL